LPSNKEKRFWQGESSPSLLLFSRFKLVIDMKIVIDGKELNKKLKAVLLKGKWNLGLDAKASSLGSAVVIEANENVYLYNGNEATYVKLRIDNVEVIEQGRCCVSYDLLNKYLKTSQQIVLEVLEGEGMLQLVTNGRIIKLPLLDRHPNNDQILYSKENFSAGYDHAVEVIGSLTSLNISNKTKLHSVMMVNTEEFEDAIKYCEDVGSGIYKLEYNDGVLTVSSVKNRESIKVTIGLEQWTGPIATVEFTGPLHKAIDTDEFIIAFNDDSPVSILSRNVQILRAPRVVDE
tara:strand:- start:1150 stop:2019 length:870 start_codon:yes stop_codon:yes gene_type:complete